MASLFICAGAFMLFSLVKNPRPAFEPVLNRFPAHVLMLWIMALAYPVWGIVGAVMGVLYLVSVEQAPGGGLGSPNLVFTTAAILAAAVIAAPFAFLLRPVAVGVAAIAVAFAGIFGWMLPHFAE